MTRVYFLLAQVNAMKVVEVFLRVGRELLPMAGSSFGIAHSKW
jgi:hypothetical protein